MKCEVVTAEDAEDAEDVDVMVMMSGDETGVGVGGGVGTGDVETASWVDGCDVDVEVA